MQKESPPFSGIRLFVGCFGDHQGRETSIEHLGIRPRTDRNGPAPGVIDSYDQKHHHGGEKGDAVHQKKMSAVRRHVKEKADHNDGK